MGSLVVGIGATLALFQLGGLSDSLHAFALAVEGAADRASANAEPRAERNVEATAVDPRQLLAEYQANEVAADARYKGRLLSVTGIVSAIGKDLSDDPYVALETGDLLFNVQCLFPRSSEPELARLVRGQQVTLSGTGNGKFGNVLLGNCRLTRY